MRHKLPCELLTYACLHMISYSQNRLRFEALTAVVSTSVNHTDQLIHPRNLFLFFNSCKLLLPRAESLWAVGRVGTGRSLLCNEAQTLQMKSTEPPLTPATPMKQECFIASTRSVDRHRSLLYLPRQFCPSAQ